MTPHRRPLILLLLLAPILWRLPCVSLLLPLLLYRLCMSLRRLFQTKFQFKRIMEDNGRQKPAVGENNQPQLSAQAKRPASRLSPLSLPFTNLRQTPVPTQSVGISTKKVSKLRMFGCSARSSRTQRRPKCKWLRLMNRERKIPRSGLSIAESAIGTAKRPEVNIQRKGIGPRSHNR